MIFSKLFNNSYAAFFIGLLYNKSGKMLILRLGNFKPMKRALSQNYLLFNFFVKNVEMGDQSSINYMSLIISRFINN